jgi:hypothetical protein
MFPDVLLTLARDIARPFLIRGYGKGREMLDRAIGIAGLAVTLTAFIVPYLLPRLPSWTKLSGLSVGFFLFGLAVGLIVADRRSDETPLDILTNLNLEFFSDQRTPRELYQHNIGTWYALWSPSATIAQVDNNGREIGRQIIVPKTWSIFLLFTKPASFRQILLSAAGGDLPLRN